VHFCAAADERCLFVFCYFNAVELREIDYDEVFGLGECGPSVSAVLG
jgi:hypothetical protein